MYRADASDTDQKIERLERELNVAYQEQYPTTDDSEISLALLRFRAQRLAKDIESFRERHTKEPLWRRLGKRVRRVTQLRLTAGFIAGVSAFWLALGIHAKLTSLEDGRSCRAEVLESAPADAVDPQAEPAATAEPASTDEPTVTTAPETGDPGPDPHAESHVALSVNDYKVLLARSHAFFRAVEKRDGRALAALAHPLKDLQLGDEHVSLTRALLRDCFSSRRTHTVNVSAASEDTAEKTCGDIFATYADTPYERAPDVLFNEEPAAPGISTASADGPFVFFYLPGEEGQELSWRGVELVFQKYGDDFVLTAVHKAYWTP